MQRGKGDEAGLEKETEIVEGSEVGPRRGIEKEGTVVKLIY